MGRIKNILAGVGVGAGVFLVGYNIGQAVDLPEIITLVLALAGAEEGGRRAYRGLSERYSKFNKFY